MTTSTPRKPRRMARMPQADADTEASVSAPASAAAPAASSAAKAPSRLDQLEALLTREHGATIAEMMEATGWQQHSVRGALAGALKKRGLVITSDKADGTRRYRAETSA